MDLDHRPAALMILARRAFAVVAVVASVALLAQATWWLWSVIAPGGLEWRLEDVAWIPVTAALGLCAITAAFHAWSLQHEFTRTQELIIVLGWIATCLAWYALLRPYV